MDTSDSANYGRITFENDAANQSPTQLIETDFFQYILQKCKYYKGIIYDHEALRLDWTERQQKTEELKDLQNQLATSTNIYEQEDLNIEISKKEKELSKLWDYGDDNWNGNLHIDETRKLAPTCHLVKPFLFSVVNVAGGVKITLSLQGEEGHISSQNDIIIPHTLLPTPVDIPVLDNVDVIRQIALQQGWNGILTKETLGILNLLSHFIDRNIYNGTRNVWVDDLELVCALNVSDDHCEGVTCPSGYYCVNGVCACEDNDLCDQVTCPPGYHCVNGVCVCDDDNLCNQITCPPGYYCFNGVCVCSGENDCEQITCPPDYHCVNGVCVCD